MHEVRRLERMIAGCPEKAGSEAEGLPPVAEEDFFFMEQLATQRPQALHIHPYV